MMMMIIIIVIIIIIIMTNKISGAYDIHCVCVCVRARGSQEIRAKVSSQNVTGVTWMYTG
jgi:hypothetical protein